MWRGMNTKGIQCILSNSIKWCHALYLYISDGKIYHETKIFLDIFDPNTSQISINSLLNITMYDIVFDLQISNWRSIHYYVLFCIMKVEWLMQITYNIIGCLFLGIRHISGMIYKIEVFIRVCIDCNGTNDMLGNYNTNLSDEWLCMKQKRLYLLNHKLLSNVGEWSLA